jgi:proton-translocating NADH-quinone oxidoreductase chain N
MNPSNALTWLIALPLAASPVIYLIGRLVARRAESDNHSNPAGWLALLALAGTFIPLYSAGQQYLNGAVVSVTTGDIMVRMDGISLLLAATVLVLGFLVTLFSLQYMAGEVGVEKFYALLTAMIGTMIGLGCANDLFNLWVWFEAMAVTSYMLVAFYRSQPASLEAGVKYLVQSATGSALVLVGIALVFYQTGTLALDQIVKIAMPSPALMAAGALFVIGFGVKTALVPMHTWLPDAHSQAPSGISAMLSGVVIETGLVALLRAVGAISASSANWGAIIMGFGALNMLFGNLMALRQKQVKRLLAYSSLSHIGYILVGIGVAIAFKSIDGAAGGFFHLINHAAMKGLAFLSAGALLYALHLANHDHSPLILDDLNGASRRYPIVAFCFSIAVLGLGGLPPLSGFMSKWQIFVAGFQTQNAWVIALVIFAALNSVLSLGYYAPLVNRMYRHEPSAIVETGKPVSALTVLPLVVLTLLIVVVGFWPTLMSWLTNPAAASLLAVFGG